GVFGADAGIVETRGDRVRFDGLAVLVLQQVRERAVQSTVGAAADGGGVPSGLHAVSPGLAADELDGRVVDERVEDADRVRSATDAGDDGVGQATGELADLDARLETDDALEVADHRREGVRAGGGAEAVVGVV